jgi:hypothetical protein
MADDPVRRRSRRAAKRAERHRRKALATRTRKASESRAPAQTPRQQRGPGFPDLPPPSWPDDLDGGAGVREPRRPYPSMPAGALELDEPASEYLEMSAEPA